MDNRLAEEKNAVGNIKISHGVVETVVKNAALEIDGAESVSTGNIGIKRLLMRAGYSKPIKISINEGVVYIQISVIADCGKRIPDLANAVQLNVKNAVQNMTGLAVSEVDVVVTGITQKSAAADK